MTKEDCISIYSGINYNNIYNIIIRYVLILLYIILVIYAIYQIYKYYKIYSIQYIFHILIIVSCLFRIFQLPLSNNIELTSYLSIFINSFADMILFSAYLLVCCYWAVIIKISTAKLKDEAENTIFSPIEFQNELIILYIKIICVAILALVGCMIVAQLQTIYDVPLISGIYIASLSVFLALFAAYQGIIIYNSLKHLNNDRISYTEHEITEFNSPKINSARSYSANNNPHGFRSLPYSISNFQSPVLTPKLPPYYQEPTFDPNEITITSSEIESSPDNSRKPSDLDSFSAERMENNEIISRLIEDAIKTRQSVTIVSFICTVFFLFKGIAVCVLNVVFCPQDNTWIKDGYNYLYVWGIYMFLSDIFPTSLILFLIGEPTEIHSTLGENTSLIKSQSNNNFSQNENYGTQCAARIKNGFLVTNDFNSVPRISNKIPKVYSSSNLSHQARHNSIHKVPSLNKIPRVLSSHYMVCSDGSIDKDVIVRSLSFDIKETVDENF